MTDLTPQHANTPTRQHANTPTRQHDNTTTRQHAPSHRDNIQTRAKAEGEAAVNLEEKRRFEQRLRLGALDAEFASRGSVRAHPPTLLPSYITIHSYYSSMCPVTRTP